jgi:hypothetical protein
MKRSYSDDTYMGHDAAQDTSVGADDSTTVGNARADAVTLLQQLVGLPQDQYGERCLLPGDMEGKDWTRAGAVGYALMRGWVTLKGIGHKRVLVCLSEEGLLAVRMHQRGYSQVLHGSTPSST